MSEEEAKLLILKKLYDLATSELHRYLNAEKRALVGQQRIKNGLMQDLLTKGIDENGVIRSEATHAGGSYEGETIA